MADKKLSLATRKNLRDFEDKKKEHLARIEAATGKSGLEFTIVDDIKVAESLASRDYNDRLGEIFYDSYLSYLADALEKLCVGGDAKKALGGAWTSKKISFEIDEKAEGYQQVTFVNGDLRMGCKSSNIWSNIDYLGRNIEDLLSSEAHGVVLPFKSAQNIRDNEEKLNGHLATIATAIGRTGPVTYVVEDIKALDALLTGRDYNNRIGEVIYDSYPSYLASKLTSLCSDEMVKEAIGEAFKGNLVFKVDAKAEGYQNCKFVGGNLVMSCKPDNVWTNMDGLGGDIEGQL